MKNPKKTAKNLKEGYKHYNEVIAPAAYATGADYALRNYDKYRRFSFWIWFVGMFLFLIFGKLTMFVFCLGLLHLQVMYNQLWWKLVHIEKKMEVKDGSDKKANGE